MESRWVKKGRVFGPFGWLALTGIFLFLFSIIIVSSANAWYKSSLKAPGGGSEKIFVVKKGDSTEDIARSLEEEGLIKDAFAFRIFLLSSKVDKKIEAGSFRLNSNLSTQEIAEELQHGKLDKWVTLVEGLRVEEMAEELAEDFDISKKKFIGLAEEGYMFPDTYLIPTDASEEKIASILKKNFDQKVDNTIRQQAKQSGLTFEQLVILASIVERESKDDDDRPIIAGILLKRLGENIPLAVDATIQYLLGYQKEEKSWWKKELTAADLAIDSPYNTRKVVGFTPKPICNPGLSSIRAVASPKDSPYYYYIHDKKGKAHFAETFEEHNSNIEKYL